MSYIKPKSQSVFLSIVLLGTFLLSSCASQGYAQDLVIAEPDLQPSPVVESETQPADESLDFVSPEEARDIAVAYLLDKFTLESPLEWFAQDQTPENLLGTSNVLFTSGAWAVSVKAPVVAPQYLVYTLEVDHLASGLHWEGEVDASGMLTEHTLSEPLQVLSPADARDAAVAFILSSYGWDSPDTWLEQSVQPTENAGVRHTFTSGAWVIQVEYQAAAPIVPQYHLIADHLSLVARWEATINADGEIIEEAYQSSASD